jgi:hypothetical protein
VLRKKCPKQAISKNKDNNELREKCKTQHSEGKATYATTIKREKIRSWKEYCNMTTAANPGTQYVT